MLDTHLFDWVLNGTVPRAWLAGRRLLVTGVQIAEIRAMPDHKAVKRDELLRVVEEIAPELCLAASFCLGIEGAGFDQAEWNDGTGRFGAMLARLRVLDPKPPRQDANQIRDIVIAETALKLGAMLVSDDCALRTVMVEFGGQTMPSAGLMQEAER